jgi:hypothetical protein
VSKQVFRIVIPVDDQWHTLELSGPIIHVAARQEDTVEFWFVDDPAATPEMRAFRVAGTGEALAAAMASHVGTAITPSGRYVWHLFEHERTGASQ